jgi:hypothetical protein
MKEVSQILHAFLTGNAYVTAIVGDRIFPIVAPEGTVFPMLSYLIQQSRGQTKESKLFDISLFCWFDQYDAAVTFHDGILPFIEEQRNFTYQDSNIEYLEEYRTYVCIINIQIFN